MTNVGTIRCAMGGQLTLRCTLWSSNLLEMWQFASIRDDFLRSLYRLYRCVWYRCVWMPIFFGHLKLRDLYMSLTYFDRCILTLYGIGASNMFFFVKHSFQICIVSQITPSNKGNLLLSIQDAFVVVWGLPCFFLVALVKMWQTCGPLALGLTIDSPQFLWLCKAHMKELQEFNQHWDQKAGSSTSRWWEFIRMHKDFLVYVESNVQSEVVRIKDWGVYKQILDVQFLGMVFLIVSKY